MQSGPQNRGGSTWTRVNVVGTSGSGKSTFARALAARLGAPYVELDALYWLPNWTGRDDADLDAVLSKVLARPAWVLDGNFHRTAPIKWARAEAVIWLDYPLATILFRMLRRTLRRVASRTEIWEGTGNLESIRKSFFSSDSIILWALKTYWNNKRRYQRCMKHSGYPHLSFVRLRRPAAARRFLGSLGPRLSWTRRAASQQ